ncbi:MAG: glucuronyl hydrolase, partial [Sediminibacterium sp.]|nr:glucuronyl hydrolase [Sediminibacterium sp.]
PRTLENGQLKLVASRDWTSGFFPGVLWYLYEYTGNAAWKKEAQAYTANIEKEKTNGGTHDMGFKVNNSFGNGYRLTGDAHYREVIIESAKTLTTRFNQKAGVIRSWDHNADKWQYPVIIDNMMNLELLFEATKLTRDSSFYRIAVTHAMTTLKNHYRKDNSSYHVIDYDTATGNVRKRNTHQGYSDESAWARGQAWGLYAYTMCYRETGDPVFLKQAEAIADYLLKHRNMPADLVPYWDFDAPAIPNEPRDASAAAIMASGLYELSTFSKQGKSFQTAADKIIGNLTNAYRSPAGENKGFLLSHSTGSKPGNSEVDMPLSYADYYYIEAVLRAQKIADRASVIDPYANVEQAKNDARWLKKNDWANGLALMPHSSTNIREFARQYQLNTAYWDAAFRFMKEHRLDTMSKGKYPIDGENVFASITEDPSKDFEKTNWESHRKYIDLQYIVTGEEVIGVFPVSQATVTKEYDEKKDVANYAAYGVMHPSVPGTFFLFFPSDAHRPNITPGGNKAVKKLVIKIRAAE